VSFWPLLFLPTDLKIGKRCEPVNDRFVLFLKLWFSCSAIPRAWRPVLAFQYQWTEVYRSASYRTTVVESRIPLWSYRWSIVTIAAVLLFRVSIARTSPRSRRVVEKNVAGNKIAAYRGNTTHLKKGVRLVVTWKERRLRRVESGGKATAQLTTDRHECCIFPDPTRREKCNK